MKGAPTTPEAPPTQPSPNPKTDSCGVSNLECFPPSENNGALANMATPEPPPGGGPPLTAKDTSTTPEGGLPGSPQDKGHRKARGSSSSVLSLMSEDGEGEGEEGTPTLSEEGRNASRPRRAAAARSKRASEAAVASTPPPVLAKYRDELQKVEDNIRQIIKEGLPVSLGCSVQGLGLGFVTLKGFPSSSCARS